jgi:predicted amidohydrolase YtcJ
MLSTRILGAALLALAVVTQPSCSETRPQTPASGKSADELIRAGAIYTMAQEGGPLRSIAIAGGEVLAVGAGPHDLDGFIGAKTEVIDDPGLTVLPGFIDTHTHLMYAAAAVHDVPVGEAKDVAEFVELIRKRAAVTPKGSWIRTSSAWNEWNLAEKRMPTANDLDEATTDHPVLVRRGGHNVVLNTMGMQLAGITRDTPTPKGGTIVKDADGNPTGWLIDSAKRFAERLFPKPSTEQRIEDLRLASLDYAAHGVTTVKDAYVVEDELPLLRTARESGALQVRVRAMVGMGFTSSAPADTAAWIDRIASQSASGDDAFRVWGLKFVLDGGAENAATEEGYVGRPDFKGLLMWDADDLTKTVSTAARRGLKVGTHAWGDRAVRTLLDVYQRVLAENPGLLPGSLVLEHGGLPHADQRARAIKMGIPVTVQHPLLHDLAFGLIQSWGTKRTSEVFPLREWVDEGALVAAGSDYPVGDYDAMASVWGMVTRQTRAGVLGPEHAVDVRTAIRLYTSEAARLIGESDRLGSLQPGHLADLVAYRHDPMNIPTDQLRSLRPAFTMVGGRMVVQAGSGR